MGTKKRDLTGFGSCLCELIFENELLTFDERELHYNCGNDAWVADLDYVGPWDTTYAFTLTVDDILIKQNYYLLDGAPSVSYEYFCRAAE